MIIFSRGTAIEIDRFMRNKEPQSYREEVDSILAQCEKSIEEAYRQYEVEIEQALEDFHSKIKKPPTWVH